MKIEWIGYTTHHLWGNIAILLLILLLWWFNKYKKEIDPTWKELIVMITIVTAFVITALYTIYLSDNPSEVVKLF